MEPYLDTIKELITALVQLTNTAREWNSSASGVSGPLATLSVQTLWDEICSLKCLTAEIERSLQQDIVLDVDINDLSCINRAVAAVSYLQVEAQNAILDGTPLASIALDPKDLLKYFKDIQDCRARAEAVLSPRIEQVLSTGPIDPVHELIDEQANNPALTLETPPNNDEPRNYSESDRSSANSQQALIVQETKEDFAVGDSSSAYPKRQSYVLSLFDSINIISRKVPRNRCRSKCQCACHKKVETKVKSEESAKFSSTKCSNSKCRSKASRKTDFIIRDTMFLRREFFLSLISRGIRVSYGLKTRPIVPASSAIILCAENGDLNTLTRLVFVDKKASIYDTEPDGWSLLHSAVNGSHVELVESLLKWGADRDVTEVNFRKPFHFAKFRALNPRATEDEKRVFMLFNDRSEDFKTDFGLPPVVAATLNEYDIYDRERPSLEEVLHYASLLATSDGSSYSDLKNEYSGKSPIYLDVTHHFEAGANKNVPVGSLFKDLLEQTDEIQGWTPLLWGAYTGRVNEIGLLLDHGADPTKISNAGRNIFHYAAEAVHTEVLECLLRRGCLEKGVDLNLKDYWGETPLHVATMRSPDLINVLLDHGARIDHCQGSGELPLHYLRHLEGEARFKSLRNLLTALEPNTALINSVNENGYPCLFYLLDTPECVKMLLDWGVDITVVDQKGRSVLHHACMKNHERSLRLLLEHCSVNMVAATCAEGDTPLLVAFRNRAIDCVLTMLRRHHHQSQMADKEGWTLLHHAVKLDDESILDDVLRIPGLDKKARTRKNQTAYDIAQEFACRWSIREKTRRF